jgi:transposase
MAVFCMYGDLTIRKVRTGSGAIAVQVVKYVKRKCVIVRHIGSANTDDELTVLWKEAEVVREQLCVQPSLFAKIEEKPILHAEHLVLQSVMHKFALNFLRDCSQVCGLGFLNILYQDLAVMRIIEPASKLRTLELLERHFSLSYARRSLCRLLPKLIDYKDKIEEASYQTACTHFGQVFAIVLYDVTTLYFESHEPDDDLRARGFSKDDKSKQPQIVVGLLVTPQGFPLRHDIYKGNAFEGHTMLEVVKRFQGRHGGVKPIIVADAAMLSQENMLFLENEGYQYIVGARLANTSGTFINKLTSTLTKRDYYKIALP